MRPMVGKQAVRLSRAMSPEKMPDTAALTIVSMGADPVWHAGRTYGRLGPTRVCTIQGM